MSASHQLTDSQRTKLLQSHHHFRRREMVRHWLLTPEDLRRIQARRREHNRLGFALQLCLLRYPGWPLPPDERPPQNLLAFVAEQLGADTAEIEEYAARDQTRREHLQILCQEYRFRSYESIRFRGVRPLFQGMALAFVAGSRDTSVETYLPILH